MDGLTEEQLAAIEARANAATPGPWSTSSPSKDEDYVVDRGGVIADFGQRVRADPEQRHLDAAFVRDARTDVPRLVAEVRRLRALLAETLPFLAHYQCDDEEEGDALADLERRVSAALAGEEG